MTKKNVGLLVSYNKAKYTSIWQAYEKPSYAKQKAEQRIKEEMYVRGGYGYKVCSKNTFNFSCAYLFEEDNKIYMVYHTHVNCYVFDTENAYIAR